MTSLAQTARMLAATLPLPRVVEVVRLPNTSWSDFLSGPLTADDWALIERVEAGEVSVDEAMAGRGRV